MNYLDIPDAMKGSLLSVGQMYPLLEYYVGKLILTTRYTNWSGNPII